MDVAESSGIDPPYEQDHWSRYRSASTAWSRFNGALLRKALYWELTDAGHRVDRQRSIPITYRSRSLNGVYRPDMIVDDLVLGEIKAVERVIPVHKAQVLTYLRLTNLKVGLLLNFNVPKMVDGVFRISL